MKQVIDLKNRNLKIKEVLFIYFSLSSIYQNTFNVLQQTAASDSAI